MSDPNRADPSELAGLQNLDSESTALASAGLSGLIHSVSTFHFGSQEMPGMRLPQAPLQKPGKHCQNSSRTCECDRRVSTPYCEIDIVHGCNLRCTQCSHFSPYRSGLSTKEDIIGWFTMWKQKIRPNVINLLGGEPFLHPDLSEIIRESSRIFPDSKIEVTTNGLLLPRIDSAVFEALREARVKVIVSDHSGADIPYQQVLDSIGILRKQNVHYMVRESNKLWHASSRRNDDDVPIPFQSNPKLAWTACVAKNCKSLMNNKLYKCSILANIAKSVEEGVLSPNLWQTALTYKPLTLDSTLEEIAAHFNTREIPECSNCPEQLTFVENKQLPVSSGWGISETNAVPQDTPFERALQLHRQGQLDIAETLYYDILDRTPDHPGATHFLGMLLSAKKEHGKALALIRKSLQFSPPPPSYFNNYGIVLREIGRFNDAQAAFERAVAGDPNFADAHSNLGHSFLLQDNLYQAEPPLVKALTLNPDHGDASRHLAELRFRQGNRFATQEQFSKADKAFRAAAFLCGGKPIWRFKSLGFCPTTFPDEASIDTYWQQLEQGLDQVAAGYFAVDWHTLPADGFIPSFNLAHLGRCCKDVRLQFARFFEPFFPQERPKRQSRQGARSRIGFHVFAGHEGGFLRGTAGIIEKLDRKRFEMVVLCPGMAVERCRREIRCDDVTFVPLNGSFEQVVRQVRDSDCDLIYYRKAGSDPWSYFLPFTRPAPIQCTSYGTHGTSGIPAVDYFLSSSFVEPNDAKQYYSEHLLCMDAMPTYQQRQQRPENVDRSEFGLPARGSIYFCPHRPSKYHPSFDPIFQQILERDPQGCLVLLTGQDPRGNDVLHDRLQRNLGLPLLKRIRFLPALPSDKYLRLLSLSTLMIDSPVYAGGQTSFDAFSFGIPEVTLSGPLHIQNFATGIYRRMGLDDLPCQTTEQFVDLAIRLGTEPDYRHDISRRILERNHLIFEDGDTVSEHERLFEMMLSAS